MKLMNCLRNGTIVAILSALVACGNSIPTQTFNDKVAIAIQTITDTRQTATALLTAKKITLAQDQKIQDELNAVRNAVQSAQALHATDPALAETALARATGELNVVKTEVDKEQ